MLSGTSTLVVRDWPTPGFVVITEVFLDWIDLVPRYSQARMVVGRGSSRIGRTMDIGGW